MNTKKSILKLVSVLLATVCVATALPLSAMVAHAATEVEISHTQFDSLGDWTEREGTVCLVLTVDRVAANDLAMYVRWGYDFYHWYLSFNGGEEYQINPTECIAETDSAVRVYFPTYEKGFCPVYNPGGAEDNGVYYELSLRITNGYSGRDEYKGSISGLRCGVYDPYFDRVRTPGGISGSLVNEAIDGKTEMTYLKVGVEDAGTWFADRGRYVWKTSIDGANGRTTLEREPVFCRDGQLYFDVTMGGDRFLPGSGMLYGAVVEVFKKDKLNAIITTGEDSFALAGEPIWSDEIHTVTWKIGNEEVKREYPKYTLPVYDGEVSAECDLPGMNYLFTGWSPEVSLLTEDTVYTAVFNTVPREYLVRFEIGDAATEAVYGYGETPVCRLAYDEGPTLGTYKLFDGFDTPFSTASTDVTYRIVTKEVPVSEARFFSLSVGHAPADGRVTLALYAGCAYDEFSLQLLYDRERLTFVGIDADDGFACDGNFVTYKGAQRAEGKALSLTFTVKGAIGESCFVDLLPTVCLKNEKQPVAAVAGKVILSGELPGDLDGDGKLMPADAEKLKNALANGSGSDLDGDKTATVRDLTALVNSISGLPSVLYSESFGASQKLDYGVQPGGTVVGMTAQELPFGTEGEAVASCDISDFYEFAGWSDGCSMRRRADFCGAATEKVVALYTETPHDLVIPMLTVNTDGGVSIRSNRDYVGATVSVTGAEEGFNVSGLSAEIRGRGNSSWDEFRDTRPSYKLRLTEKAWLAGTGNGAERDWVLLTVASDKSMLRNWATLRLGDLFDNVGFSSGTRFIELTVNGNYLGVYLLCEQVEVSKMRIDIDETATGDDKDFLVVMDARGASGGEYSFSFANGQQPFVLKSYTADRNEANKIRKALVNYNSVLLSGDEEEICKICDIDTFVDMFILEELGSDRDVGFASFYMIREDGMFKLTAPWDFDLAWGNDFEYPAYDELVSDCPRGNDWFAALVKQPWFRALVKKRMKEVEPYVLTVLGEISMMGQALSEAADRTYDEFDVMGIPIFLEPWNIGEYTTYQEHIDYFTYWYDCRYEWLWRYFKADK